MVSEAYGYILTESAEADLDDILDYTANKLKHPDAATAFADELEECIENVCKAPHTGSPVNNEYVRRKDIRYFRVKNYIAYYIADDELREIVILRVVYGRMNQDNIVRKL